MVPGNRTKQALLLHHTAFDRAEAAAARASVGGTDHQGDEGRPVCELHTFSKSLPYDAEFFP